MNGKITCNGMKRKYPEVKGKYNMLKIIVSVSFLFLAEVLKRNASSLADPRGGALGTRSPGPISFYFHAVFGRNLAKQ